MKKARLFKNGESQAVRLPKEFRLKGEEVYVLRRGRAVILLQKEDFWDSFFQSAGQFSADFMKTRKQGEFERDPKF